MTDLKGFSTSKIRWLPTLSLFALPVVIAAIWGSMQEPEYRANAKVLFQAEEFAELTGVRESVGEFTSLARQNPLLTELEVLKSRDLLERTIEQLDLRGEDGELLPAKAVSLNLSVKVVGAADVIDMSYVSEDPELPAQFINTLAENYILNLVERKTAQPIEARRILRRRLQNVQERLEASSNELRLFQESNNLIDASGYSNFVIDTIASLDNQILETQARLDELSVRINSRASTLGVNTQQATLVRTLNQDPTVAATIENLAAAESQLAQQRAFHNDSSPIVISLQENVRTLRSQLEQLTASYGPSVSTNQLLLQADQVQQTALETMNNEEVDRMGLTSRLSALQASRDAYTSRLQDLPSLEGEQSRLQLQIQADEEELAFINEQLQRLVVAERSTVGNASLIETAQPPTGPAGSNMRVFIVGGILLGGLCASTYNFWQQQFATDSELK